MFPKGMLIHLTPARGVTTFHARNNPKCSGLPCGGQDNLRTLVLSLLFTWRLPFDLGHWLILGLIKRQHSRLRDSQRSEMRLRRWQAPLIGEGRPIAPRQSIGCRRCLDRCLLIARIVFDLRQDIAGIGVKEPEWPALGRFPDVVQQLARGLEVTLSPPQLRQS